MQEGGREERAKEKMQAAALLRRLWRAIRMGRREGSIRREEAILARAVGALGQGRAALRRALRVGQHP